LITWIFGKIKNNKSLLGTFFSGQILSQLLQISIGFLVIRLMSKNEFAEFAVTFGVQTLFGTIIQMGLGSAILALVGNKHSENSIISKYFNAAWYWRLRLFYLLIPIASCTIIYYSFIHEWLILNTIAMILGMIVGIYFSGLLSFYTVILRIKKKLRLFYRALILTLLVKFFIVVLLYLSNALYGWSYIILNSLTILLNYLIIRSKLVGVLQNGVIDDNSVYETKKYVKPLLIGVTFAAFQSQISILLVGQFGRAETISDIGALNRLGSLFSFFGGFNTMLIQPWFARMRRNVFLKSFSLTSILILGILFLIACFAFYSPSSFQLILGSRYSNLNNEIGFLIVNSSLGFFCVFVNSINGARKWVFWWPQHLNIIVFFILNVFLIRAMDLSIAINVIYLSIINSLSYLIILLSNLFYGFKKQ